MKKVYVLDAVKIVFQADAAAAGFFLLLRFLQALVPTLQTLSVAGFIDQVTAAGRSGVHNRGLLFFILILVALVAFNWLSKSITGLLEQHMEMRLRTTFKSQLVEKISRLNYDAMENGRVRDQISRVNKDAEKRIREAYARILRLLELILKAAGVLIILFTQVWWLAFFILAVSVPCFYISMKSGKEDYDAQADVTKVNRMNEYYNEMLKGREYVDERTVFGYHREYRERFLQQYEEARKYTTGIRLKWFIKMKAGSMAVIAVSAAALAVMIPLTLDGVLSTGMFVALMNAIFGIVQNMSWDLTYSIDRVAWYQNYFRELSEVFSMSEDQTITDGKKSAESKEKEAAVFRTLEFRNVTFRYPGTSPNILKNLSFKIDAGKKYAFVGANGAGKTTIVKLINGLYPDYEGEILVNGEEIHHFERGFLSNVFQDFARYPVSIRENITIGRKDQVSEEELLQVVREVGLDNTVERLEDGLDTVLGKVKEESLDLSGGEWQKVALARCALSKAPVRILDEPTSAMDPVYENEIYQRFQQISQGKTVLLISHRLASVKMSDFIFVIADGAVAEAGSHWELMEKNGLYRTMYEEQAKWYEKDREGGEDIHES